MESYKTPLHAAEVEFTEKKSRFISNITQVSSQGDAIAFLRSVRETHREATHNVYAYRIMTGSVSRHSDDGEPSGTAGMPLLDVFVKQEIYDFCCVATRYFGGVMLGAGGLVRAYSRCGAIALEASGFGVMREMALCALALPYSLYEPVKRLMIECGAGIDSEDFLADVEIKISLSTEKVPVLQTMLNELTAGSLKLRIDGTQMRIALI